MSGVEESNFYKTLMCLVYFLYLNISISFYK